MRIVYRWSQPSKAIIPKIAICALVIYFGPMLFAEAMGISGADAIYHPGFIIIALFVLYLIALSNANKTTTTITDTAVKTHRGPFPCLWPGNHTANITDVREICYARRYPNSSNPESPYCVFMTFKDGSQVMLFAMEEHERFILLHAREIQRFIDKKQSESGISSSTVKRKIVKSATIPPTTIQKIRIVVTVICLCFALISVALSAEKMTARLRVNHSAGQFPQH